RSVGPSPWATSRKPHSETRGQPTAPGSICSCAASRCPPKSCPCPSSSTPTTADRSLEMTVKYSNEHEWIRVEGDVGTVGISQYAQEQLGDVVFVDVPQKGRKIAKGESVAVVESVKAASDIYAPASGEVVEANAGLADSPGDVN